MGNRHSTARTVSLAAALLLAYVTTASAVSEETELVSVKSPPTPSQTPSGPSFIDSSHTLSRNGRFVVFSSQAGDLLADQDITLDTFIFVRDRQLGTTTQLKVSPTALYIDQPSISDDGRYVAFLGYGDVLGNGQSAYTPRVYVMDLQTHAIEQISVALGNTLPNDGSFDPMISGNGRYVVFDSLASNLVAGDTNGVRDVFFTDRARHTTERVSRSLSGQQLDGESALPFVSSDGRYVVYHSFSSNATTAPGYVLPAVLFYDRNRGVTELSSQNAKGVPANTAGASNASVSDDGRYVAFLSQASNLVPGNQGTDGEIFVRDRVLHSILCASISSRGELGNFGSSAPTINGDGTVVGFASIATNLVPNDTSSFKDTEVFVHDLRTGATERVDVTTDGMQAVGLSFQSIGISISGDGQWVGFNTTASNLAPNDLNGTNDVFVHQLLPRTLIRVNAGGPAFTDSVGRLWQADRGFNTGLTSGSTAAIANTNDPGLYQDQRYDAAGGPELRYEFPVPNGTYLVRLHFAENYEPNFHAGKRVFDVDMEGIRRFTNLDIFAAVGGHAALVLESAVTVVNGKLDIDFHHEVENPQVNAIEIIQQ
jgi:Tol biopolymer transport system component